jgi:hypothetical protein
VKAPPRDLVLSRRWWFHLRREHGRQIGRQRIAPDDSFRRHLSGDTDIGAVARTVSAHANGG